MSCPKGHAVISVDYQPFSSNWKCDGCKKSFTSNEARWRCCSKCNFDLCLPCIMAVDFKPNHSHALAYVMYVCNECRESSMGDRVYCPTCKVGYDACYRCALCKIAAKNPTEDGGGGVKSIIINPTPFASGATRDAFKVAATMKDGKLKE